MTGGALDSATDLLQAGRGWIPETARNIAHDLLRLPVRERRELGHLLIHGDGEALPDGEDPQVRSLAEYLERPELLLPPDPIIPRLAWRERVTLLVGREKSGKSTLAVAAASAMTRGGVFLAETCPPGAVIWVNTEEHPGDLAKKAVAFGANPEAFLVTQDGRDPLPILERAIQEFTPELLVIDTLPTFVRTLGIESGDAAAWTAVMTEFTRYARSYSCAVVLLHHATKVGGDARDSTAIPANVDVEATLGTDAGDPDLRRVTYRGRFYVEPWAFYLQGDPMAGDGARAQVRLTGAPMTLEGQIREFLERTPGASTTAVRTAVSGRAEEVSLTLTRLASHGVIQNQGSGSSNRWYLTAPEPSGNVTERGRNGSGNGSRSDPRRIPETVHRREAGPGLPPSRGGGGPIGPSPNTTGNGVGNRDPETQPVPWDDPWTDGSRSSE